MKFEFVSNSESETHRLGNAIGELLYPGCVVTLEGELGAGKTRLVQAIAAGLEIDPAGVNSPTYTICVPHEGRLLLLHIDAYRIKDLSEMDLLALDDHIEDGAVLMIEWPSRVAAALPPVSIQINISHAGESTRRFELDGISSDGQGLVKKLVELLTENVETGD